VIAAPGVAAPYALPTRLFNPAAIPAADLISEGMKVSPMCWTSRVVAQFGATTDESKVLTVCRRQC
jgi:hypothetical protein